MSHILLTGAAGFIGAHMLEHLIVETDAKITCLVSLRHRGASDRIAHLIGDRVSILAHDLIGPLSARQLRMLAPVDHILHFAAESHVERSIEDPVPFVRNNVNATLHMLEVARVLKPTTFVQVSTDEVYGPAQRGVNHAEWAPILPSNPYSASKAAQEAIAISYWRTYGVPLIITNTMNNIGERQDAEKYVPMIMRCVRDGIPVTVHGSAEQPGSRFYLHARNHADALLFLINKGARPYAYSDIERPERYNVVGDVELTNLEIAQRIAEAMGRPLYYEFVDHHSTRPGHDLRYALDGGKIAEAGWVPPVTFAESLVRTVEWTMAHPEWLA